MKKRYDALDVVRYICSLLVVAIHTAPFIEKQPEIYFVLVNIIARVAVPFFFAASGFFLSKKLIQAKEKSERKGIIVGYTKRIVILYLSWTIIYLPLIILRYRGEEAITIIRVLRELLYTGTMYHLWYLPASIVGVWILWICIERLRPSTTFLIFVGLYVIGMLGNIYMPAVKGVPLLGTSLDTFLLFFETTRGGFFFAPIFLFIGYSIPRMRNLKFGVLSAGLIVSVILLSVEVRMLDSNGLISDLSAMYIMLIPFIFFLLEFVTRLRFELTFAPILRKMSSLIYFGHIYIVTILNMVGASNEINCLLSIIVTSGLAYVYVKMSDAYPILKRIM